MSSLQVIARTLGFSEKNIAKIDRLTDKQKQILEHNLNNFAKFDFDRKFAIRSKKDAANVAALLPAFSPRR